MKEILPARVDPRGVGDQPFAWWSLGKGQGPKSGSWPFDRYGFPANVGPVSEAPKSPQVANGVAAGCHSEALKGLGEYPAPSNYAK